MDRVKVLLVSGAVLVLAAAVWRSSPGDAPVSPQPLPLSADTAPAPAAAPATPKPVAAPAKPAANGEIPDDYVYVPPQKPKAVVAVASTPAATAAPETPGYERAVADAAALGDDDRELAVRRLERMTADEPSRPEAYESLAAIRLQQGDYYQAFEMFGSAIRHGGQAAFAIMHDHTRGNFDRGPDDTCAGELVLTAAGVGFTGADGHRFEASWPQLQEAGANRFFGSGIGGFHVKIAVAEGKSRNFNLAPRSRDKREANIILDLLIENAQRRDGSN